MSVCLSVGWCVWHQCIYQREGYEYIEYIYTENRTWQSLFVLPSFVIVVTKHHTTNQHYPSIHPSDHPSSPVETLNRCLLKYQMHNTIDSVFEHCELDMNGKKKGHSMDWIGIHTIRISQISKVYWIFSTQWT